MHRQSGTSLLELLVACAVLAAGVVATVRLHADLRGHAELNRERGEAMRLAQEDLERLRTFTTQPPVNGQATWTEEAAAQRFTLTRTVAEVGAPNARLATVAVTWTDRSGTARNLSLDSMLPAIAPTLSGALALDAGIGAAQRPLGRSPRIPVAAVNLGDGRSVWKPAVGLGTAFVFDNTTGAVTARCTGLAAGLRTTDLGVGSVAGCGGPRGQLLAGEVRTSAATPPSPGESTESAPAIAVGVEVDGTPATPPLCVTEARKTVRFSVAGSLRVEAVPVDALPASVGAAAWVDTGERHTAYACVVTPPDGATAWSGRPTFTLAGHSACRYASDAEHASRYSAVSTSLAHQNILLVASTAACPAAPTVTITGSPGDVFADLSTAP